MELVDAFWPCHRPPAAPASPAAAAAAALVAGAEPFPGEAVGGVLGVRVQVDPSESITLKGDVLSTG